MAHGKRVSEARAAVELRARLAYSLGRTGDDGGPDGSLFLHALACTYLAAPESAEATLGHEYQLAVAAEHVDGDALLSALCLVEVP